MTSGSYCGSYGRYYEGSIIDSVSLKHTALYDYLYENEVNQYLRTLVMRNNDLIMLTRHKAILRRDHTSLDQVKILSGGPAGNEPLCAGLVGPGLLTAAVLGDSNSCPPHTSILAVIQELSQNESSVFVIVMNYASYRLNFGIAIQNALLEGIKVAAVIVEDDCSGVITDKTVGRRTLTGMVYMIKVVGAMAEDKKTLYEIECVSKSISKNSLGTITIHFNEEEVTFGVGLKGEPGKLNVKDAPKDIALVVKKAMSFIVDPASYFSLVIKKNDDIAILVNNFSGMLNLFLSRVVNSVIAQVNDLQFNVISVNFGNYLSSKFINGFSITLFKLDNPRVLKWLMDENIYGSFFTAKAKPLSAIMIHIDSQEELQNQLDFCTPIMGPKFTKEELLKVRNILNAVIDKLLVSEGYINSIDFDHDCGTTLTKFATEVRYKINNDDLCMITPHSLLNSLSEISATNMEGMSSGIYSVLFSSAAQAFLRYSSHIEITHTLWAQAATFASKSLYNYIRVQAGYRTIVDALQPFAEALHKNPKDLASAVEAAEKGVENTISMLPKAVTGTNITDKMLPDAGAYAFMISVKAAYEAFINEV